MLLTVARRRRRGRRCSCACSTTSWPTDQGRRWSTSAPALGPLSDARLPDRGRHRRGRGRAHRGRAVAEPPLAAGRLGAGRRAGRHAVPGLAGLVRLAPGRALRLARAGPPCSSRSARRRRRPTKAAVVDGPRRASGCRSQQLDKAGVDARGSTPYFGVGERRHEAVRQGARRGRAQRRPAVPLLPPHPAARLRRREAVLHRCGAASSTRRSSPWRPRSLGVRTPGAARLRHRRAERLRPRLRGDRGPVARPASSRARSPTTCSAAIWRPRRRAPTTPHRPPRPAPGQHLPRRRRPGLAHRLRLQRDGGVGPAARHRRGRAGGVVERLRRCRSGPSPKPRPPSTRPRWPRLGNGCARWALSGATRTRPQGPAGPARRPPQPAGGGAHRPLDEPLVADRRRRRAASIARCCRSTRPASRRSARPRRGCSTPSTGSRLALLGCCGCRCSSATSSSARVAGLVVALVDGDLDVAIGVVLAMLLKLVTERVVRKRDGRLPGRPPAAGHERGRAPSSAEATCPTSGRASRRGTSSWSPRSAASWPPSCRSAGGGCRSLLTVLGDGRAGLRRRAQPARRHRRARRRPAPRRRPGRVRRTDLRRVAPRRAAGRTVRRAG